MTRPHRGVLHFAGHGITADGQHGALSVPAFASTLPDVIESIRLRQTLFDACLRNRITGVLKETYGWGKVSRNRFSGRPAR